MTDPTNAPGEQGEMLHREPPDWALTAARRIHERISPASLRDMALIIMVAHNDHATAKPATNAPTTAEELARLFHETYERLAPNFGYETRKDTRAFDADSPNGLLMTAVCVEVMAPLQRRLTELQESVNEKYWEGIRSDNVELKRRLAEAERERDELRRHCNVIMFGLTWTGDGYEWSPVTRDYRESPPDAVRHAADEISNQLAARDREIAEAEIDRKICPCKWTAPCSNQCTCAHPHMSRGCTRCCSYGSVEQRQKMAENIVAHDAARDRKIEAMLDALKECRVFIESHPDGHPQTEHAMRLIRAALSLPAAEVKR